MMPYILIVIFTLIAGAYVSAVLQNFGFPLFAALGGGVLVIIFVSTMLMYFGRSASRGTGGVV
ncbi:MAG: hypothetical protein HYW91_00045 [Candidatus Sungbacteria bacterium]|nr:hypothetical protein [Candidatus Sungbacteria bacterium]